MAKLEAVDSDADLREGTLIDMPAPVTAPIDVFSWSAATATQRLDEVRRRLNIPD